MNLNEDGDHSSSTFDIRDFYSVSRRVFQLEHVRYRRLDFQRWDVLSAPSNDKIKLNF